MVKDIINKIIETYNSPIFDYNDKVIVIKAYVDILNNKNLNYEQKENICDTLEEADCDILRICGTCDKLMSSGICVEQDNVYCTEECFIKDGYTKEDIDGDDVYYTDWI